MDKKWFNKFLKHAFNAPDYFVILYVMKNRFIRNKTMFAFSRNVFPENLIQATIATYRSKLIFDKNDTKAIKGNKDLYFLEKLFMYLYFV